MIVLTIVLCLAGTTECSTYDFQSEHPVTKVECQKTAPAAVAALVSQMKGDYTVKEFRCRDRSEQAT